MNKIINKIILVSAMLLLLPTPVSAAVMRFNPTNVAVPQAVEYSVVISIDTQEASINAVDGVVLVSKELGDAIQVSDSASVVTYWVQQPTWDAASRTITFSGAVPGGYTGSSGILFSIILPPYSGSSMSNAITATNLHAYQNDGLGTPLTLISKQFSIGGVQGTTDSALLEQLYLNNNKQDGLPPETFSPQVARDERVFGGKWFINFATTDKQSGIDRYEIQESRTGAIDSGKWKVASSPYLLEDQELHSFIYITAIDRQGNERVIKVFPKDPQPWWQQYGFDIAVLAVIILIILLSYWYYKRKAVVDPSKTQNK